MVFLTGTLYLFSDYGARITAMLPKTLQNRSPRVEDLWAVVDSPKKALSPPNLAQLKSMHAAVGTLITGLRYKVWLS